MKPTCLWICVAVCAIAAGGCRNANQIWKPNPLAGLGSPRIAPPATGSFHVGTADPYYNTTIPALPSSGTSGIPAQPASTGSPGWRAKGAGLNGGGTNGGSQVPARPASLNQTSFVAPNGRLQIPMNNVVSSTQTSLLRPSGEYTANLQVGNVPANNVPRLAGQPGTTGMQVNDSTNLSPNQLVPQGNWNQLARTNRPGSRSITGSYQYEVTPTRSGSSSSYQYPYNSNGGYATQPMASGMQSSASNTGWQEQRNPQQQNFNR